MNYEQFEKLILESTDRLELQNAFSLLTPAERKSLSAKAVKLKSQLSRGSVNKEASERLRNHITSQKEAQRWNSNAGQNASVALFAVGPVSSIKRSDVYIFGDDKDIVMQIILDRNPDWLDDWVSYDLEQDFSTISFPMLRKWVSSGVCVKPKVDGYFKMYAWNLKSVETHKQKPAKPPLSEQLLAEPDMLDDVWGLFTTDTQAFDDPKHIRNRAPDNYESWSDALIKLSSNGVLDRNRLLDASLSGLLLDIKQNYLSGFHKFHKSMKPNAEELTLRQHTYLDLMCHKVGHVVKFSLAMLKLIEKAAALDGEKFLSEVPVVFQHDTKGIAVDSVRLVKLVIKKNPLLLANGLYSLFDALRHSNVDVQSIALEVFEDYKDDLSEELKTELVTTADFVSLSIKGRVLSLANDKKAHTGLLETNFSSEQLKAEFDAIEAEKKVTLGVSKLFASDHFEYYPIVQDIILQDVLMHQEAVKPISDLDNLILSVSQAVESVESPDDVERILDGLSRLCDQRPSDFSDRVAPLLHRLESGGGLITKEGIASGDGGTRLAIADLLLTWLTGKRYRSPNSRYFSAAEALIPVNARLENLTKRVIAHKAQPLIAAPTHTGGWIDPLIWAERVIYFEKNNINYDRTEFCFSLLRLAPDNRDKALKSIKSYSSKVFRVANFTLGGDELPKNTDRKDYDIWISAARARDPYRDWSDVFEPLNLTDNWADSLKPAIYEWQAYQKEHSRTYNYGQDDKTVSWKTPHLELDVKVNLKPEKARGLLDRFGSRFKDKISTDTALMPAAALNRRKKIKYTWSADLNSIWLSDWLTYQWPLCPDAGFITGVRQLIARIDMDGSNWEPSFGFMYGLFQKNRPWREAGHLLICIGLIGKDADARGLAIDALIAGIENGCLDIDRLSETLVKLSDGGWLKLNRLGDNLLQVSQVSLLHAWVISEVIQHWLHRVNIKQRYLFRMLEVLKETQFAISQPLSLNTNEKLKQFSGSAKAAKVAKELLKGVPVDASVTLQIKQELLNYRVQ